MQSLSICVLPSVPYQLDHQTTQVSGEQTFDSLSATLLLFPCLPALQIWQSCSDITIE